MERTAFIVFSDVYARLLDKTQEMLSHSWGWVLSTVLLVLQFLSPAGYCFLAMGVAIGMDLLFGIMSAKKRGEFLLSEILRNTPVKVVVYGGSVLVIYVAEMICGGEFMPFTKMGSVFACGCELWSMLGSALIIWPNAMFPRLLKLQLKGEIESKLGAKVREELDKE